MNMNLSEMKQVINLLDKEWDLGKKNSQAKGKICAWIYFLEIMEECEKIILEKRDKEVIGICGYANWNSKKHRIRKKSCRIIKLILIHSPYIKNKKAIYQYYRNYDYTPKELEHYFDGEISILIIDKKYRGMGLGTKLINKIFDLAKKDNIKNLQILTDESCNFQFYEQIECKKIYEKIISNQENNKCGNSLEETGYIYEKKLI